MVVETTRLQKETTDLSEVVSEELKQEGKVTIEKMAAGDLTAVSALGNRYRLFLNPFCYMSNSV